MGLDVTAYETATLLPEHTWKDDECWEAGHVRAFAYAAFEQSFRGLVWTEKQPDYQGTPDVFIGGREYLCGGVVEALSTGYGSHRVFRDMLAKAAIGVPADDVWADPERFTDQPFFELINFADNEGCIGPEAAADLLADFREHAERVQPLLFGPGDWADRHVKKYDEWQRMFEIAAGGGLVHFH